MRLGAGSVVPQRTHLTSRRSVRPEVIEHLATAADALAAALRELGALRAPGGRPPESADRAGPTYPDRPETEHIVIADDDQDEGAA